MERVGHPEAAGGTTAGIHGEVVQPVRVSSPNREISTGHMIDSEGTQLSPETISDAYPRLPLLGDRNHLCLQVGVSGRVGRRTRDGYFSHHYSGAPHPFPVSRDQKCAIARPPLCKAASSIRSQAEGVNAPAQRNPKAEEWRGSTLPSGATANEISEAIVAAQERVRPEHAESRVKAQEEARIRTTPSPTA